MNYLQVFVYLKLLRGFCYLLVAVCFSCTMARDHGLHDIRPLLLAEIPVLHGQLSLLERNVYSLIVECTVLFTSWRSNLLC